MLVALQRYVVALLLSHQVLSESHAPRQQQLNIAAQLGRPAARRPIAKRIRWFVDGHDGMLSGLDQTFMFDTHADIVDGAFPCCGFGGVNPNGTLWTFWDHPESP